LSGREIILDLIKNRRNIPRSLINFIEITGNVNCLYKSTYYYLHQSEEKYKEIRELVYNEAKNNKEELKPFFYKTQPMIHY